MSHYVILAQLVIFQQTIKSRKKNSSSIFNGQFKIMFLTFWSIKIVFFFKRTFADKFFNCNFIAEKNSNTCCVFSIGKVSLDSIKLTDSETQIFFRQNFIKIRNNCIKVAALGIVANLIYESWCPTKSLSHLSHWEFLF